MSTTRPCHRRTRCPRTRRTREVRAVSGGNNLTRSPGRVGVLVGVEVER